MLVLGVSHGFPYFNGPAASGTCGRTLRRSAGHVDRPAARFPGFFAAKMRG